MAIPMELSRVLIRETEDHHVVELREVDGDRIFPIVIGLFEAAAIERRLLGQIAPRPQTHELLESIVNTLGGKIEEIIINDLRDHTFYAQLVIRQGEQVHVIDSRPSDAIALGATQEVPIFVEEDVLEQVCPVEPG